MGLAKVKLEIFEKIHVDEQEGHHQAPFTRAVLLRYFSDYKKQISKALMELEAEGFIKSSSRGYLLDRNFSPQKYEELKKAAGEEIGSE